MKRKSNSKIWKALEQKIPDYLIQAGWFEESKYKDGTPIGGIAAVQNYGATINHPGGTAYFISELAQRAVFISSSSHLGHELLSKGIKTKPHTIVIPPTHFWENCQKENKEKWKKLIKDAWTSVFLGNITPDKAVEQVGMVIEGDIAKAIAAVENPPLAQSTIAARKNRMADKKTTGNLTKRLVDSGTMFDAVSHKVTKL